MCPPTHDNKDASELFGTAVDMFRIVEMNGRLTRGKDDRASAVHSPENAPDGGT
jgi:hypothetical protein